MKQIKNVYQSDIRFFPWVTWFEHATFWSVVRRSIQLSYTHIFIWHMNYHTIWERVCQAFFEKDWKGFIKKHRALKVCPNKKTWRKWNSWKTAGTRKFPAGILWLRLSRGTDAVAVAFSISECKVSYLGAPFGSFFTYRRNSRSSSLCILWYGAYLTGRSIHVCLFTILFSWLKVSKLFFPW